MTMDPLILALWKYVTTTLDSSGSTSYKALSFVLNYWIDNRVFVKRVVITIVKTYLYDNYRRVRLYALVEFSFRPVYIAYFSASLKILLKNLDRICGIDLFMN